MSRSLPALRRAAPSPLSFRLAGAAAACLAVAAWSAPAGAQAPMPLAGHRAVYDLSLADGSTSKTVESARGRILFEFNGSTCEGYTQTFGQIVELAGGDIGSRVSATRSTIFEEGDGSMLRFNTQNRSPAGQTEETDGSAKQSPSGIEVTVRKPAAAKHSLGEGLFPTAHVRKIIAAAKAGETTIAAMVFDGSEKGERGHETFAVIGKPLSGGEVEASLKEAGWQDMTRWPVSISYFEPGAANQTPVYIVSFELLENGVSRKLKLDYGEFALKGDINRIETLKTAPCDK